MKLVVVVLAGGEGRRMGGGKSLRTLNGATLVGRMVEAARRLSPTVAVSVRDEAQAGGLPVPLIFDDPAIEGPLAGLAASLSFAAVRGYDALITLPCDLAAVPADLLPRLSARPAPCVLARAGEHLHPTLALWRPAAGLQALPDYLATGRRSLLGLAERVGFDTVEWPEGDLANLNTPEDLAAAERAGVLGS